MLELVIPLLLVLRLDVSSDCSSSGFDHVASVACTQRGDSSAADSGDWGDAATHHGEPSVEHSASEPPDDSPPPPIVWTSRLGVPESDATTWCKGWITGGVTKQVCLLPEAPPPTSSASPSPSASAAPTIDIAAWAAYAASTLHLPDGAPAIGPDPAANEWDMLVVGLPVWFWTADQPTVDATLTMNGITIELSATRASTTLDLGDGTTLTCTTSTPRPADADPMQPSPTCGHTYYRPATYSVEATTWWTVRWSALGQSGRLSVPVTARTPLRIGELESVIVERRP